MAILKDKNLIKIDPKTESEKIIEFLKNGVHSRLKKRGAVLGISGGIDSSVVASLCVNAFGADHVVGVLLPEKESSIDSSSLAIILAKQLGIETINEPISAILAGSGCYLRRDEAIRRIIPEFMSDWKSKITLPGSLLDDDSLNVFFLTVVSPEGKEIRKRIPPKEFAQIVAASNFKQRTRMAMLYFHAERLNYAVIGTANKDEHDLGFFVKNGDGGVDIQPIVHLFKTQVYQLAEYLQIPEAVYQRTPTSDTYSAGSSQEEFFFRLPFDILDNVWSRYLANMPSEEIASTLNLTVEQVNRIIQDIRRKQQTTEYLRASPLSIEV